MTISGLRRSTVIALAAVAMGATAYAGDAPKKVAAIPPGGEGSLNASYTIAFWGIPFGASDLNIKVQKDAYQTSSTFKTTGVVSAFWQSDIQASSNGAIRPGNLEPAVYDSYDQRRADKKQRVKVTFSDADPTVLAEPPTA